MARQPGDTDFTNVNAAVAFKVAGTKVLGTQQAALSNGVAQTLINSVLVVLREHGLIAS